MFTCLTLIMSFYVKLHQLCMKYSFLGKGKAARHHLASTLFQENTI